MSSPDLHLPLELVQFLEGGHQLYYDADECEPGPVKLAPVQDLEIGEVWIETGAPGDPNADLDGYYAIPAVSLLSECDACEPDFILLWLPNEQLFGSWDYDRWTLTVFPNTRWSDITRSPVDYLNALWYPDSPIGEPFVPWTGYTPVPGRPI